LDQLKQMSGRSRSAPLFLPNRFAKFVPQTDGKAIM
jgi:hypothetical protein